MHVLQDGVRGLKLLLWLNSDRLLYLATILFALCLGAFIGSLVR